MERVKESYLNDVLEGMMIPTETLMAKVIDLSDQKNEGTIGFEQRARGFYAEPLLDIPSEEFIKMMIVDGCFLVQLFRKCNDPTLRDIEDPVFNMDCMFHFLCHDLLLLENQLPWFVLESLYSLILGNGCSHQPSLAFVILEAFITLPSLKRSCNSYKQHLSSCHGNNVDDVLHILDLVRSSIVIPSKVKARKENKVHEAMFDPEIHEMHTVTALSKAGIKFKGVKSESMMDIQFKNGVFTFPQLYIGTLADSLFRNLIAFEQCYNGYSNEITSYAILMDNLISSKEDMELLCKAKVIGNWLSEEDGCKFFNNLYKGIPHNKFYYVHLCKQVNEHYRIRWHKYLASLKIEKFSNPWKIIAFFVAIVLLGLSIWTSTNNIRTFMQK
ncbi:hypothetical protein RchiOBHm_Chr4g0390241 [Rosa chinensis]|uniref:Uncharacterized protein n=1 Tax=Rosa chinensis TaxID=74649 RepID=A0A2P6QQ64_ROSCH|nr:UPF0481 protein At3g47200 [Rosa chinensis]PRQ36330.1 hypothetical protein RchiOBHm_Chr4g0390241 [Rosa chinensis]